MEPALWDLHHNSEDDWRRILAATPEQAADWIRFAAERGFRAAQVVLGQMHLDGRGVSRDLVAAYAWFGRAAAIGSLDGRNLLGRCHELGWGVPVDHEIALAHYRRAAKGGHGWGHYNVGCLLRYGDVRRDHAQAFRCFTTACQSNQPDASAKAMGLLGRCHEEGWGTSIDLVAAEHCYAAASEAGDCWGALNLAFLLSDRGQMEAATIELDRAIRFATANCLNTIVKTLERGLDPIFSAARERALERLAELAGSEAILKRPNAPAYQRPMVPGYTTLNATLAWAVLFRRNTRVARRHPRPDPMRCR